MKNKLIAASAVLLVGVLSAGAVFAQSNNPYKVDVGANGNIRLEGTIVAKSGSTLNVESWGGIWSVNTASASDSNASGTFTVGEPIIVIGTTGTSSMSVNATAVNAPEGPKDNPESHKGKGFWANFFGKFSDRMHVFIGTVGNINVGANTFTLTSLNGKHSAQVDVNSSTDIKVGTSTATTSISGLISGMFARVFGSATATASGTVISATDVRAATGIGFHLFGKHDDEGAGQ